jgi:hypothetical protein
MSSVSPDDHDGYASAGTTPGRRIPGPPTGGLLFLLIAWLIAAAVILVEGGAVFVGILKALG